MPRGRRVDRVENEPHEVDVFVGRRIRARRLELDLTQSELAKAVGITFQQVQKYEKGKNRISMSRLWLVSQQLKVPPSDFFPPVEGSVPGDAGELINIRLSRSAAQLSPKRQLLALKLMKAMARQ